MLLVRGVGTCCLLLVAGFGVYFSGRVVNSWILWS